MKILKFNESNNYESIFTIQNIDIEDNFIEVVDSNFSIKINKFFTNKDDDPTYCHKLDEPINKDCYPWYQVILNKKIENSDRSSSYISDNTDVLKSFIIGYNRCKSRLKFDKMFYQIRDNFNIFIRLPNQKFELGFDSYNFKENIFLDFINELIDEIKENENVRDVGEERYGNHKNFTEEIYIKLKDDYIISNNLSDNKFMYDDIVRKLKDLFNKYSNYLNVNFEFNPKETRYGKIKLGMFRTKEIKYTPYTLGMSIKFN